MRSQIVAREFFSSIVTIATTFSLVPSPHETFFTAILTALLSLHVTEKACNS